MKCDYLDMQASGAMESITARMTFDNFDQSMRFLDVIIKFIREEKADVAQDGAGPFCQPLT